MPMIQHPARAEAYQVSDSRTGSDRAVAHPTRQARRILRNFLAGLNKLLGLSDFRRGDYFRD